MAQRLIRDGIEVWGFRRDFEKAQGLVNEGKLSGACPTIAELVKEVKGDGNGVFQMVVPAESVDDTLNELLLYCTPGDVIIDHGNSNFKSSRVRAEILKDFGISYIDCGTSGGVYGLDRGYCLMVGGDTAAVAKCSPIFSALAPGISAAPRTDFTSEVTSAEKGWLHCGGPGAGHFVKMVHNGIEYGIMQAYAEGFNILKNADAGSKYVRERDAEVAPMADPESYCYDIDVAEVAELWRRGSVVGSWLLDLTAEFLRKSPDGTLERFEGGVSDSGEGRWTVTTAVDLGVPAPVITTALYERFNSRNLGSYAAKILNGMRFMFGGHLTR